MSDLIMAIIPCWLGFFVVIGTPLALVAIWEMYDNAFHNIKRRLKK